MNANNANENDSKHASKELAGHKHKKLSRSLASIYGSPPIPPRAAR